MPTKRRPGFYTKGSGISESLGNSSRFIFFAIALGRSHVAYLGSISWLSAGHSAENFPFPQGVGIAGATPHSVRRNTSGKGTCGLCDRGFGHETGSFCSSNESPSRRSHRYEAMQGGIQLFQRMVLGRIGNRPPPVQPISRLLDRAELLHLASRRNDE